MRCEECHVAELRDGIQMVWLVVLNIPFQHSVGWYPCLDRETL